MKFKRDPRPFPRILSSPSTKFLLALIAVCCYLTVGGFYAPVSSSAGSSPPQNTASVRKGRRHHRRASHRAHVESRRRAEGEGESARETEVETPEVVGPRRSPRTASQPKSRRVPKTASKQNADQDDELGFIDADLPFKVERDKQFDIDVWVTPRDKEFRDSVKVYMEQTYNMKYEPRVFYIKPGERKTVHVNIIKTYSGIAEVYASADGWEDLDATVDTGFAAKLKTNIEGPIESNKVKSFSLSFTDNQGNPVPLDADVKLTLQSSNVKIHQQGKNDWVDNLELDLKSGSSTSPVLEIRSDNWSADTAMISAETKSGDNLVLHDDTISIEMLPRWYVPLLMAILGGALYSVYELSRSTRAKRRRSVRSALANVFTRLSAGALAGTLAYLLVDWGILGIKVDKTTLQGFVILGFFFSYIGIDLILRTATGGGRDGEERAQAASSA
jgi:hypothetical protein